MMFNRCGKGIKWLLILSSHFCFMAHSLPEGDSDYSLSDQWLARLQVLSSDEMAGRQSQTLGAQRAALYINNQFSLLGLSFFPAQEPTSTLSNERNYIQPFNHESFLSRVKGNNIVGMITGHLKPERYIVVTAHYDHIGIQGERIFNGADDNASGVVALLEIAHLFKSIRPRFSWIFVATDAEEAGLYGAKAFVNDSPINKQNTLLNLNLDMLAQGGKFNRLYFHGLQYAKSIKQSVNQFRVEQLALPLTERVLPAVGKRLELIWASKRFQQATQVNWLTASDHFAFYRAGIPYLYIGVAPHALYHTENDTWQNINLGFYEAALYQITALALHLDKTLE